MNGTLPVVVWSTFSVGPPMLVTVSSPFALVAPTPVMSTEFGVAAIVGAGMAIATVRCSGGRAASSGVSTTSAKCDEPSDANAVESTSNWIGPEEPPAVTGKLGGVTVTDVK